MKRACVLLAAAALCACGGTNVNTQSELSPEFLTSDLRLNTSQPAGAFEVGRPAVCCDAQYAYTVWMDKRNGLGDIFINRTVNSGSSWLTTDIRVNTDTAGSAERGNPVICCFEDKVYVAWLDKRDGFWDVRFNRSLDAGVTWLFNDLRVNTNARGTGNQQGISICCQVGSVFVSWSTIEDGRVHMNRSFNAGAGFRPTDTIISDDGGASPVTNICCDTKGNVFVAWQNNRSGSDRIYTNSSTDEGATWLNPEVRVDTGSLPSTDPVLVCGQGQAYVMWREEAATGDQLLFSASQNQGITYRAPVRVDHAPDGTEIESFRVAGVSSNVHAVWSDTRSGLPDVHFNTSTDTGMTWRGADLNLNTVAPGSTASTGVQMCASSNNIAICWSEATTMTAAEILFTFSTDTGVTWFPGAFRVNTDSSATLSIEPFMCCDSLTAHVAWFDTRSGDPGDIYYNRAR